MKTYRHGNSASLVAFLLLAFPFLGQAQEQTPSIGTTSSISLELDPAAFILNGYSFSLRYSPKVRSNWSVMASCFAADFPDEMLTDANRDNGWSGFRFRSSNALFIDYSLRPDGRGFFFGPSVFLYNNTVMQELSGSRLSFRSIYPNVRLGYTWFPFKRNGLYVSPYLNLGSEMALGDARLKDGPSYYSSAFKYIVALHVGYRLNWDRSKKRTRVS